MEFPISSPALRIVEKKQLLIARAISKAYFE